MKLNPKNPCPECPFRRKSGQGWLGEHDHVSEIIDRVEHDLKFPCHMDVNDIQEFLRDECDDEDVNYFDEAAEQARHCVGAVAYLNNRMKISRDPAIATQQKAVGKRDDVFARSLDMIDHHHPEKTNAKTHRNIKRTDG